ncbi:MAG: DUF721 domain-containing protein [Deltaproteobacteria bacterium]|nr:DUF721 domain-containing protein [Candidatus Anaeroferrophillus wilburensis]MBN2889777.1 DUF721 domain-containing protein [Deltaproteobacteria bacterium]
MAADNRQRAGWSGMVGDLLPGVLDRYKLRKKMAVYQLFSRWQEVVGPQLMEKCQPLFIRGRTLHIKVVNHGWMHQLYFFQDRIIERFNALSRHKPVVTHLHFELGELAAERLMPSAPRRHSSVELISDREKRQIKKDICRYVKDPELADIIYTVRLKDRVRQLVSD